MIILILYIVGSVLWIAGNLLVAKIGYRNYDQDDIGLVLYSAMFWPIFLCLLIAHILIVHPLFKLTSFLFDKIQHK